MRLAPFLLLVSLVVLTLLPGCRTRDFRTEGDILRAQVQTLEREIAQLERRNRELEAEVRRRARADELPEDIATHVPQVVELGFARFSHARDMTGDGWPNELRLYLQTLDGRGRFAQVTGELTVDALLMPRDPAAEPIHIGTFTLGPEQLRDAYRSGFMGTHYTIRMPVEVAREQLEELSPGEIDRILVRAALTDALTGQTHLADRTLDVRDEGRGRGPERERGRERAP